MRPPKLYEYVCVPQVEGSFRAVPRACESDNAKGRGRGLGFDEFALEYEVSCFAGAMVEDSARESGMGLLGQASSLPERAADVLEAPEKAIEGRRALSWP